MTLLCLYAIMIYAFLTISVPLWQGMNTELGFSYTILNDSYGVSAATLSVGCLIFTPFAMRFGRRPVYIVTSLIISGMDIWSARIHTVADVMVTNVFMGLAGSVNEALFQMTASSCGSSTRCGNLIANRSMIFSLFTSVAPQMVFFFWLLLSVIILALSQEATLRCPKAGAERSGTWPFPKGLSVS